MKETNRKLSEKIVGATSSRPHFEEKAKEKNGITLVALIITIIVMLILVGVTVTVAINGGIFNYAKKAVDDTKIEDEKHIVTQSSILAMIDEKGEEIKHENLQKYLDELAGENKTIVYDTGDAFEVFFKESGLYYEVDKYGNTGECKTEVKDKGIANIFLDEERNELDGTKEEPYQINCIEDLVMLSNISRGVGNYIDKDHNIVEIEKYNAFRNKYFELTRTLNFISPTSYADLSIKWSYDAEKDAYVVDEASTTNLMEIITDKSGVGFVPIGIDTGDGSIMFSGVIDGKCHEIQNIYENRTGKAGLITRPGYATIKNIGLTGEFIGTEMASSFGFQGGTLYNCYSTAKISSPKYTAGLIIEGGKMINCYFNGQVTANGMAHGCGKAIGLGSCRNVINCYNLGVVNGKGGDPYVSVAGLFDTIYDKAKCVNSCSLRISFYKK